MAHPRKTEQRLLTADEMEFVEKARHPVLGELAHADLHALVQHLRDRRDRAQTIANNQRRSLRGKGGRGEVTFEKADVGNRQKAAVLTDALTRARREMTRRAAAEAREQLISNARHALAMKRAAHPPGHPDAGQHANEGMHSKAKTRADRIGSRSGEAGRVTKFVATAQAKKDAR
ncbi:hypothetical protein ABLE91_23240 [Aquabacter sp. CN5-332]|uniref:hypothetical protein n=1 Tax=Aquabacter sp. CN5-332 TaxID=3156608 RepID=UPI0032B5E621